MPKIMNHGKFYLNNFSLLSEDVLKNLYANNMKFTKIPFIKSDTSNMKSNMREYYEI